MVYILIPNLTVEPLTGVVNNMSQTTLQCISENGRSCGVVPYTVANTWQKWSKEEHSVIWGQGHVHPRLSDVCRERKLACLVRSYRKATVTQTAGKVNTGERSLTHPQNAYRHHNWTGQTFGPGCCHVDVILTRTTFLNIFAEVPSIHTFRGLVESMPWWIRAILAVRRGSTLYKAGGSII